MTDIGNCFLTGTDTEVGKTHAAMVVFASCLAVVITAVWCPL